MDVLGTDETSDRELKEIYNFKNIAVVGMSPTEGKPANYVSKYLIEKGYNVLPVNPIYPEILNRKSYKTVSEIPSVVDVVDIFRKSEDVLDVVENAISKEGIKVIWMQKGIYNKEAETIAIRKGIKVVYNRCMLEEHERFFS